MRRRIATTIAATVIGFVLVAVVSAAAVPAMRHIASGWWNSPEGLPALPETPQVHYEPGAIEQARTAASGKDVAISGGGNLLRQVIRAGLLDQLELHISPVLIGDGMRLFDRADHDAVELSPTRTVHMPGVTHIRYKVNGPSPLALDDRGRGTSRSSSSEAS